MIPVIALVSRKILLDVAIIVATATVTTKVTSGICKKIKKAFKA